MIDTINAIITLTLIIINEALKNGAAIKKALNLILASKNPKENQLDY